MTGHPRSTNTLIMSKDKAPPLLSTSKSYDDWVKLIKIWKDFTSLDKSKQALAIVLSLEDKAQQAALEIDQADLIKDDGVDSLITRLDKIYKKDELSQKFSCLEDFESYKRPESLSIRDYVVEFEKRHFKVKSYKIIVSDDLLGFRLLKAANLSARDEQLIKATVTDIKFEEVKTMLTKIFSEHDGSPTLSNAEIKPEPIFHASEYLDESFHQDESEDFCNYDVDTVDDTSAETFYTNYRRNQFNTHRKPKARFMDTTSSNQASNRWRPSTQRKLSVIKGKNPPDKTGMPTRCMICQSINHWAPRCPDKNSDNNTLLLENEITLHQSNTSNTSDLKSLVSETWSSALLDCGASKTVCGSEWLEEYKQNLTDSNLRQLSSSKSHNFYRFGDGRRIPAKECVSLPAIIGTKRVIINTDVVDSDIPLLLSRDSMKKANMSLNFENDTISAFGENIPLFTTESGHYAIPITKSAQIVNQVERESTPSIILSLANDKSDREIAIKLHRQFAHPSENKLLSLINNAGHPWCKNENLKKEIKRISKECKTCMIYKRPPPRPVVALPTATRFKETVAMDIKFYNGNMLLHMVDHATRLSAASVIPNKQPETIVQHIFDHFLQVYGKVESFLSDNGGEFINQPLLELCEVFGIKMKTTAAESPWSNGLVARHNLVLAEMLDKVIDDTGYNLKIVLPWCINAKNSLYNIHGFSPFQLALGCNPTLPSILSDKLPALTNKPTSSIIKENLEALHKARQAFIQAENSEKIKRALVHNIRTSSEVKYFTGDPVYYKRANSNSWHGPAVVLGQDGQQVLVKHGGSYVRVHPCRLTLIDKKISSINQTENKPPSITSDESSDNEDDTNPVRTEARMENANETERNLSTLLPATTRMPSNDNLQNNSYVTEPSSNTLSSNKESQQMSTNKKVPVNSKQEILKKIKPNLTVKFKDTTSDSWNYAKTISRAGKVGKNGKYPHWWNVEMDNSQLSIDLTTVEDLSIVPDEEAFMTSSDEDIRAKQLELY